MSWLLLIILSAFFYSIVDVGDKFLCANKIKSVFTFIFIANLVSTIYSFLLIPFVNFKISWGWPLFFAAFSTVFYFFLWLFWLKGLQKTEVSRATAIYSSSPIYTAILAVIFLHESLSVTKWLAIFLIVLGSILCSYEKPTDKKRSGFNKMYLLIVLAALCNSLGGIFTKAAVGGMSPLLVDLISLYAGFPLFFLLLFNKVVYKDVVSVVTNFKTFITFFLRGFFGFLGVIAFYLAMGAGPASLVIAGFSGTNPVFVFLLSIIISYFSPKFIKEEISPKILMVKSLAIFLIVGGVVLISF